MRVLLVLAGKELRDGLRNRWVAATIVLLAALAASLAFLGAAPAGTVKASTLTVTVVSLSSLTVYLVPLIALLLSYDALVGEAEQGTLLLLLTYPVARWQVIAGKALGHGAILAIAILVGYGGVAAVIVGLEGIDHDGLVAFALMMATSLMLGLVFIAFGYLASAVSRERATAAGLAVGLWLLLVGVYDLVLVGLLVLDDSQAIGGTLFSALMLLNPADAYRILNLTGSQAVGTAAGMADLSAAARPAMAITVAALCGWLMLAMAATMMIFRRREL